MKLNRLAVFAALAAAIAIAPAQSVKIGSPAPKLQVAKWIKGKEFKEFEKGKIYVMEFWATWCGPCKEAMPHLTKLAKEYPKVTFTGVSVFENQQDEKFMATVEDFVQKNGQNMGYNVGADDKTMLMAKGWMEAAGQNGIPATFVISDQKVAWIGHPLSLEPVLKQIIDGKYDASAEAKRQDEAKQKEEKIAKIMGPIAQAASEENFAEAVKRTDKAIIENPDMRAELSMVKFQLMLSGGIDGFGQLAKDLANGLLKNDSFSLNEMAWNMVDEEAEVPKRDYPAALVVAERAVEASKGQDWMILDTLALAQFKNNLFKKALENQEKAVALMNKDKTADADSKKELNARLERYKKAAAGG